MPTAHTAISCPNCSAPASGRFCASCGAALGGLVCGGCEASLSPDARFCHRCGTAVGHAPHHHHLPARGRASGVPNALPWTVAAIALVALIALVAGQRFSSPRVSGPTASATAEVSPVEVARGTVAMDGSPLPAGVSGRATDISNLSPRERADRLFDRVMRLNEEGKQDSVRMFATMAIPAYQMLDTLDADARYDMARVAEVAGALPLARAQADSILREYPTHLLGLILVARTSRAAGDEAGARAAEKRLLAAESSERGRGLPEYARHAADIDRALRGAARR